jgi:hypothetical protein
MRNDVKKIAALLVCCGITSVYAGESDRGQPLNSLIQPGFYGRVDIGNGSPPPVVYAEPVIVSSSAAATHLDPIYLHVPPGHAKDWVNHCSKYKACNRPVYFVRSGEYLRDEYYSHQDHAHDYENQRYVDRQAKKNL